MEADKVLKDNNSFCLVPWIHSYISPQGKRCLCAVSNDNFGKNLSLEEFWNSEQMKEIRRKMMRGESLSECERCHGKTVNVYTYKTYFNTEFAHRTEDILKNTSEDGTYNQLPQTLDYRTNVCNFKCKMCTEEYSTQIQNEKTRNNIPLQYGMLNKEERERSVEIIDSEFNNENILKNLLELYWAGGEPMFWKTHWDVLKNLIDKNYAKNVILRYHSNLSTIKYKDLELTECFKHFKKIKFFCSLDGTGEIGEWIRSNLDYFKWRLNFAKLVEYRNSNDNLELTLSITVNTPTLFDFDNLYNLCKEFAVIPDFQTCHADNATNLLCPRTIPKKIVQDICDAFLQRHANENNLVMDKFKSYINFLYSQEFFEVNADGEYRKHLKRGAEEIAYLEKNRPHETTTFKKIISQNKDLEDFYNNI